MDARIRLSRVFQQHTEAMAEAVVELFVDYLWRPGESAEDDPDRWTALTMAVARLRPLAATSVASVFDIALAGAAERATERVLAPDAADTPPGD